MPAALRRRMSGMPIADAGVRTPPFRDLGPGVSSSCTGVEQVIEHTVLYGNNFVSKACARCVPLGQHIP